MKHAFLLFCFLITTSFLWAQKPEHVYGYARVQYPPSWYMEQSTAWKKVIDKDPKDAEAWYNYYYANRNLLFHDPGDKRSPEERNKVVLQLVDEMGKNIPDTYEYNLCRWMSGGMDMALLPYLEKAEKLGEGRTEHLDYLLNIGELERDPVRRDNAALKKYEAGLISTGMLYYNYNVLAGLAPNAILLTGGDNDTYPAWVLQARGNRRDVTVINMSLLLIDSYRSKLFKELGLAMWTIDSTQSGYEKFIKGIVAHIAGNSKKYPVYLALTLGCDKYSELIQGDLYLTGLAYRYSKDPMDNMALLKRNFEQVYALDYIEKTFFQDISPDLVKIINGNYLVPMLKLFDHYKTAGDSQKEEWIRQKLLAISKETDNEQEVKKHVAQN